MNKALIRLSNSLLFLSYLGFLLFGKFSQSESIRLVNNVTEPVYQETLRGFDFILIINNKNFSYCSKMGYSFLALIVLNILVFIFTFNLKNRKRIKQLLIYWALLSLIPIYILSLYPSLYQQISIEYSESLHQGQTIINNSKTPGSLFQIIFTIVILSFNLIVKHKVTTNKMNSSLIDNI